MSADHAHARGRPYLLQSAHPIVIDPEILLVWQIDAQVLLKSLRQDAKRFSWGADLAATEKSGVHPTPSGVAPEGWVITVPRFRLPDNFRIPSWPSPLKPRESSLKGPGDSINNRDGPLAA